MLPAGSGHSAPGAGAGAGGPAERRSAMYQDNRPCEVCGSEVRLRPRDEPHQAEADGTVDVRVCSNPDCATHAGGEDAPEA